MIGRTISHYEIVEKLGEGGMGVVYKARDSRLGRTVAIKVVNAEFTQRFEREARAIAALNHPHICTLYDVGEQEGAPYLVMEYVEGQPLKGPLAAGEALPYAIQICEALAAAHKAGIIHRDLKPDNVLLTAEGSVKVLDFGLAKLQTRAAEDAPTVTMTEQGVVTGTAAYMSPEQARGEAVDARSDIFSFGVVLYELLSGRRAFRRDTIGATLVAVITSEPPALKEAPSEVARIVGKMLAKKRESRYQNAEELLTDLRAAVTGAARLRRRMWMAAAATSLLAIALAAALDTRGLRSTFLAWMKPQTPSVRLAVLPFANLTGDPEQEYFSDGLTESLITQLATVGALRVTSRTSIMRYKRTEKALREIASELGVDAVIEGSAQRSGDRVRFTAQLIDAKTDRHLWADAYDRPIADVLGLQSEVAREIARQVNVRLTPDQQSRLTSTRKVNPRVYEAYVRGKFYVSQNTPESFEKGIKLLREAVEIDPAEPLAYVGLAEGYVSLGHGGAERPDSFPRARAAAEQALKLEPDIAEAVGALGDVALYYEWDWTKAESLLKRALELNPSHASSHYHYAWYLALFNRLDEAIAEHKLARDLDPLVPGNTAWLGQLYNYAGRYDEAIVEARKAIELNPKYGPSYSVLRYAYSRKGMHREALAAAERGAELDPIGGGAELGAAYALAGQRQQALAVLAKIKPSPRSDYYMARAYAVLGNRDAAIRGLEAAYQGRATTLPWIRVHGGPHDSLRSDPRFGDLLRRMKLPP